ncbi:MAG TPA: Trm112 family protein [Pseudidiomarina sp.]|nr:Trm112 family protein [Pseudidiomarina sp.]
MNLDPRTLALLVCPQCKGRLEWRQEQQELVCRGEKLAFPVVDGIPQLLLSAAREMSSDEIN